MKNPVRIVIGQRGWVWVGRVEVTPSEVVIHGARVVRRWGTERGLAQIAIEGPTSSTVLDDPATVRMHVLAIVGQVDCREAAWTSSL
jgi:hypothetical protein